MVHQKQDTAYGIVIYLQSLPLLDFFILPRPVIPLDSIEPTHLEK